MRVICHIPVARSAELLENDQRVGLECISFPKKTMRRGVPLKASRLARLNLSSNSIMVIKLPHRRRKIENNGIYYSHCTIRAIERLETVNIQRKRNMVFILKEVIVKHVPIDTGIMSLSMSIGKSGSRFLIVKHEC
ncbi:hypothetical protein VTP01DRAFT_4934 [Rhizomucor pusillus]|uniref:uncharacterized protein n=1 Tax=Rhizomucor pusillus TaxID=4840 RepID=UPI0037427915